MKGQGFKSAYEYINGAEPEVTFRGNLIDSPYVDPDPDDTFDYIFYKGDGLEPTSAATAAAEQRPNHPGIFASDHLAIFSDFELNDRT